MDWKGGVANMFGYLHSPSDQGEVWELAGSRCAAAACGGRQASGPASSNLRRLFDEANGRTGTDPRERTLFTTPGELVHSVAQYPVFGSTGTAFGAQRGVYCASQRALPYCRAGHVCSPRV